MEFQLRGKYGLATVFTENIDEITIQQIMNFLNEEFTEGVRISIMPDTHAGKGAVIGTTMEFKDKLVPNLVGADIGCGVLCVEIGNAEDISFEKLDKVIFDKIPLGANNHEKAQKPFNGVPLDKLYSCQSRDTSKLWESLGTLGGGNHFIELSKSDSGRVFLTIHTGSRSVGTIVSKFHQKQAYQNLKSKKQREAVEKIKEQYPKKEWHERIKGLEGVTFHVNKDLAYLEGEGLERYLHDLGIAQAFAKANREKIAEAIVKGMEWSVIDSFDSIHNYVDLENKILRKGAISAQKGERIIVPINMKDGSLIAIGRGNSDWNYSAPHGAGRLLSRSQAKNSLSLEEFKDEMKDIHSSSVGQSTLDEAPAAYKKFEDIVSDTKETMDIELHIKPIYNLKGF